MSRHAFLWPCAVTLALFVSSHASACGHGHKSYPKDSFTCTGHQLFQCGEHGVWHKVPGQCDADPPQPEKIVADQGKAPATEQGKEQQPKTTPSSN